MADDSVKGIARRRVFVFFSVFMLITFALTIFQESDQPLHFMDDVAVVLISAIALAYIWSQRKNTSPEQLRKQHNVIAVLFAIALIFKIYAFVTEMADPSDFGDEIPSVILLIVVIFNRFV